MLRKRRKIHHEINAGSMADIAFLMLVFFLLTSTLDRNYAFTRTTPPPEEKDTPPSSTAARNILNIRLNASDDITVDGKQRRPDELAKIVETFILNPANDTAYSQSVEKDIKLLGKTRVSVGAITLATADNSSYAKYITVNDKINLAFGKLRNELSVRKFGMEYTRLDNMRRSAIDEAYPLVLNEE